MNEQYYVSLACVCEALVSNNLLNYIPEPQKHQYAKELIEQCNHQSCCSYTQIPSNAKLEFTLLRTISSAWPRPRIDTISIQQYWQENSDTVYQQHPSPLYIHMKNSPMVKVYFLLGFFLHHIGGQRGGLHHSVVELCSSIFSSLPCFCPVYRSSPNLK